MAPVYNLQEILEENRCNVLVVVAAVNQITAGWKVTA